MYRRRRLGVLLIVLLLVAAGVALAVWQPWRALADVFAAPTAPASTPPADPSADASPASTQSPAGSETAAAETPAAETPTAVAASPSPSATYAVCSSGDIAVTAVMDQNSYGAGEQPQLSMTLVNEGDEACIMNVGTATQSFVIESGTDTWWRSTDCQSEPSDHIVQLEAGQSVSSVTPITWDRTRSSVDTCEGDRAAARPGYYNLVVSIGGIESDPRQFRLL